MPERIRIELNVQRSPSNVQRPNPEPKAPVGQLSVFRQTDRYGRTNSKRWLSCCAVSLRVARARGCVDDIRRLDLRTAAAAAGKRSSEIYPQWRRAALSVFR